MSLRKRLIAGFWATMLGPFVTLLVQLLGVPLFLHFWGARLYGEWLILSAIPAYLAISDLGFGSVAGNDMAIRIAVGDRRGALETFQSTWVIVIALSLVVGLSACGLILVAPLVSWLQIVIIPSGQARLLMILLSVYSLGVL